MKLGPEGFSFTISDLSDVLGKLPHPFRKKIVKADAFILFIDDEDFPVIDNLVEAGWTVKKVKDIKNIDEECVQQSHIIFIDYKGVGKKLSPTEEGIGLIKALKGKYKHKKRIILYSGYNQFSLGDDISAADNYIAKNSDTYEFINLIETELEKLL